MRTRRIFMLVLDSFGAGAQPDAEAFGDAGAHTIGHIYKERVFHADNLCALGLGNIEGLDFLGPAAHPLASYGRMTERSMGKDTTVGHWELAGLISEAPLPTYPNGFPPEILWPFEYVTGRGILCNKPYSGTEAIRDYGEAHMLTGDLIVYTSADSVFQIAAHESVVPAETLYAYCRAARTLLLGKHGVGRVIARPFTGQPGNFTRTGGRRDFSIDPPGKTVLDALDEAGQEVIAVGKVADLFAGRGISRFVPTHSNTESMAAADALVGEDFTGLCFINFIDFDTLCGHRGDVRGYAACVSAFDAWLGTFLPKLRADDLLILTADHGCDPAGSGTDHTREYVPVLLYGQHLPPRALGTRKTFADAAATIADVFGIGYDCPGTSMLPKSLL